MTYSGQSKDYTIDVTAFGTITIDLTWSPSPLNRLDLYLYNPAGTLVKMAYGSSGSAHLEAGDVRLLTEPVPWLPHAGPNPLARAVPRDPGDPQPPGGVDADPGSASVARLVHDDMFQRGVCFVHGRMIVQPLDCSKPLTYS